MWGERVKMEKFRIIGEKRLYGRIKVDASKNSILPIVSASLLTDKEVIIEKIPEIADVFKMFEILRNLGSEVVYDGELKKVSIKNNNINSFEIPERLASELRSSFFMLGPMLSRFKKARVAYPGGCDIGSRPIDLHLFGLRELGVKISEDFGFITCDGASMKPSVIHLDFPSVGATENLMMASVLVKGETIILNPAKEPEIIDLQNFINQMGGDISGAGSNKIVINGVKKLHGTTFSPIPDRIVAGTYMIATALTRGRVEIEDVNAEHVFSLINKLKKSGCNIEFNNGIIIVESSKRLHGISFETQPYPGFPTDLQPQLSVLSAVGRGVSVVTENLFETRFRHLQEMMRMGAKVTFRDRMALIRGVPKLHGASVIAHDLRGGAALTLAGLVAHGVTTVENVNFIDRGYVRLEKQLNSLGAEIERIKS